MIATELEAHRRYLFGVAYRLLGSTADAEDVVQEALVRAIAIEDARSPRALLTTIVTRLCLDELRSARRRDRYVGPWLPEPVATSEPEAEVAATANHGPVPEQRMAAAESVSMGFLLLLEALTPHERAVFVLREVLDFDFDEIAASVDRSEAACRQLLHRARAHVAANRRRFPAARDRHAIGQRFWAALARGDVAELVQMLAPEASTTVDHGGKARASTQPIVGAERVARFLVGLATKGDRLDIRVEQGWINENPALLAFEGDRLGTVLVLDTALVDGHPVVIGLHAIRNPDKLDALRPIASGGAT